MHLNRKSKSKIKAAQRWFLPFVLAFTSLSACSGTTKNEEEEIVNLTGTVVIETDAVTLKETTGTRTLRLYLPPSYQSDSSKRYPVIYMHDAQNLFDDATSFVGEWGVDENLDELAKETGFEVIVVGIDNHPQRRLNEYSAWDNDKYGKGNAEAFVNDIVNVVKPYIDNKYRTKPDVANTAMLGSSLGGLLTHYAVAQHSSVFSKAGVFSPSYWYAPAVFSFTAQANVPASQRWYFLAGDQESSNMVANMNQMKQQMIDAGHSAQNLDSKVVVGGKHNEALWRGNFTDAISFLFTIP